MTTNKEDSPTLGAPEQNEGTEQILLKRLQTNLKISLTKRKKKLENLIKTKSSKEVVLNQLENIAEKVHEAEDLNSEFLDKSQDQEQEEEWIKHLRDVFNTSEKNALLYIETMEDTTPDKPQPKQSISSLTDTNANHNLNININNDNDKAQIEHSLAQKECLIRERIIYIQQLIDSDTASHRKIKCLNDKLGEALNCLRITSSDPSELNWFYKIEHQVDICSGDVLEYISEKNETNKDTIIQKPINNQLERIQLPKFEGKKDNYFTWKSAFDACVEATTVAIEI